MYNQNEIKRTIVKLKNSKKGEDITLTEKKISNILEELHRLQGYQDDIQKTQVVPVYDTESNIVGWSRTSHHNPQTKYVIVQRIEAQIITAESVLDEIRKQRHVLEEQE